MDEGFFGERVAAFYDQRSADASTPEVVGPVVDLLADLAGDGAALEFAIGTGRIVSRLREKPGAERIEVVVGDMATTRLDREFSLVYLVFNTISNLTTQDAQVACFQNAADHLRPGGRFVIENNVPALQSLPPGQSVLPFRADPEGFSFDVYDVVTQRFSSQHFYLVDGRIEAYPVEFRYAWPAELDLMARLAGMQLEDRWAGWKREPFTALSPAHVSVYRKA
jgi:SAM-dependent methyltransferase